MSVSNSIEKDEISKLIGQAILYLRKQKGITQVELSKRTNKTQVYISKIEREGIESIQTLKQIAEALQTTIIEILITAQLIKGGKCKEDFNGKQKVVINIISALEQIL